MTETASRPHKIYWAILAVVFAVGIFLRISPAAFAPGALLHPVAALHPNPAFSQVGFDEALYRNYLNNLIKHGITSYPDISRQYIYIQSRLSAAILPPTRFLYLFSGYLWQQCFGVEALAALRAVSSFFSILLLGLSTLFAARLGGRLMALAVAALVACAPTQIHMSQHALIDGVFAFWAVLSLWLLWENLLRPNNWRWLGGYTLSVALLVITKENAVFAFVGLLMLLALNHWLKFGEVTRPLLGATIIGPLLGIAILVNLCGSLGTTIEIFRLLVSKAATLPYAIATGDGPWYRYLVDLMLVSPVILVLAFGGIFRLHWSDKPALYLAVFVAASYVLMANIHDGMNLRYTNMWDMPLRYLSVGCLTSIVGSSSRRFLLWLGLAVGIICLIELRQYEILFVRAPLYELVPEGFLRALSILK